MQKWKIKTKRKFAYIGGLGIGLSIIYTWLCYKTLNNFYRGTRDYQARLFLTFLLILFWLSYGNW